MALAYAHIEPPQKVLRQTSPEVDPVWLAASPLQALLDEPNPWHDQLEFASGRPTRDTVTAMRTCARSARATNSPATSLSSGPSRRDS